MNIVDSSGWLSYFADEPSAKHFQNLGSGLAIKQIPNENSNAGWLDPKLPVFQVEEKHAMMTIGTLCVMIKQ